MSARCKDHPDAPHGYDHNGSHNAGRYVCVCQAWEPDEEARMSKITQEQIDREAARIFREMSKPDGAPKDDAPASAEDLARYRHFYGLLPTLYRRG